MQLPLPQCATYNNMTHKLENKISMSPLLAEWYTDGAKYVCVSRFIYGATFCIDLIQGNKISYIYFINIYIDLLSILVFWPLTIMHFKIPAVSWNTVRMFWRSLKNLNINIMIFHCILCPKEARATCVVLSAFVTQRTSQWRHPLSFIHSFSELIRSVFQRSLQQWAVYRSDTADCRTRLYLYIWRMLRKEGNATSSVLRNSWSGRTNFRPISGHQQRADTVEISWSQVTVCSTNITIKANFGGKKKSF